MIRMLSAIALIVWRSAAFACEGELTAWLEPLQPKEGQDVVRRVHFRFAEHATNPKPCAPVAVDVSADGARDAIRVLSAARTEIASPEALVLVDVGRPSGTPELSPENAHQVAKLARAHPHWGFRLIRGDLTQCEISTDLTDEDIRDLASDPAATVTRLVTPRLPRERLSRMARLLGDGRHPRLLLVVSETPPVWLVREAAEWLERPHVLPFESETERKERAVREQDDVADGAGASDELRRLFSQGRVVLVSRSAALPETAPPAEANVARTIVEMTPTDVASAFRVHRGFVDVDVSTLRRLSSGDYPLTVSVPGTRHATVVAMPEPVRPNFEIRLIHGFQVILGVVALVLVLIMGIAYAVTRDEEKARVALWEGARNGSFAFAGLAAAAAIALIPTAETSIHAFAVSRTILFALAAGAFGILAWLNSLSEPEL